MTLEHFDTLLAFVIIITGVSLLVTTLTQMISALLGLRGTNLHWGLQTLLTNLDPNLAAHAETIAQKVLHHPLISDSTVSDSERKAGLFRRWKLASAIRKDELIKILRMLAQPSAEEAKAGALSDDWKKALNVSLTRLLPGANEKLHLVLPELKKILVDDPAQAEVLAAQMISSAQQLSAEVGDWFDSVMDRVSQRFAVHMRIWTIVFSIVLAFVLQLDAFHLFTSLSSDAELRARLVASADVLTKKADDILSTNTTEKSVVYLDAMKLLIAAHPELKGLPEPVGFVTQGGGQAWLAANLAAKKISQPERWMEAYDTQVLQTPLQTAANNFNSILKNKLSFRLFPDPYPVPFYRDWAPNSRIFWGIFGSAALLSLGAPFWFNMLKTLSNLRPVVAGKEEQERTAQSAD